MAGQVGSLEFPFVPAGYDPRYVYQLALAYAQQRAGYQPHMVMQEGHLEDRDGVPGVWIKYNTPQGSSTEWTPLPMQQQAPPVPTPQPQPSITQALAGSTVGQHVPDAANPLAVAYAQRRLRELDNLGIAHGSSSDPAADWRSASQGIAGQAMKYGYQNPRDFLALGAHGPAKLPKQTVAQRGSALARGAGITPQQSRGLIAKASILGGQRPSVRQLPQPMHNVDSFQPRGKNLVGALNMNRPVQHVAQAALNRRLGRPGADRPHV